MARVLFINSGSEGHINPTIGVVRELISRGEEVVYFCIEAFRERIEKTEQPSEPSTLKSSFRRSSLGEEPINQRAAAYRRCGHTWRAGAN